MGGPSGHLERERGITVLNAEVLELVTELANDVLKSHDDLVSTSELFLEPRHARISLQPVLRRSRDNPVPLNELAESARGFAFASLPSPPRRSPQTPTETRRPALRLRKSSAKRSPPDDLWTRLLGQIRGRALREGRKSRTLAHWIDGIRAAVGAKATAPLLVALLGLGPVVVLPGSPLTLVVSSGHCSDSHAAALAEQPDQVSVRVSR